MFDGQDIGMTTLFICFWSIFSSVAIIALVVPIGMLLTNLFILDKKDKEE
jgi:hypothetical protein